MAKTTLKNQFEVNNHDTLVTASGPVTGSFYSYLSISPSANSGPINAAIWGLAALEGPGSITGDGHLIGVLGWCDIVSSSAILAIGTEGKCNVYGGATNMVALEANMNTMSAGASVGNAIGVESHVVQNTGTIANLIGFFFPDHSTLSNITTKRALRIDDQNAPIARAVGSTSNATIYQDMAGLVKSVTATDPTPDTTLVVLNATVIPGGTLKSTGDSVRVETWFRCSTTNNNKNVGLRVGANNLTTGNVGAGSNGAIGWFEARIMRTGSNTQMLCIQGRLGTTNYGPSYFAATETEASDIVVWPLAQSATAAEIENFGVTVDYFPVNH